MANPVKGEVAFEHEGRKYVFVLGTYAFAALQRRTGLKPGKFFGREQGDFGPDDGLALMWSGLLRHHDLSERQVADLMDAIGDDRCAEIIGDAVKLAFPSASGAGQSDARPPMGSETIGTANSS